MKVCKGACGLKKPIKDYYKGKSICKKCYSKQENARYHAKKSKRIEKTYGITVDEWNKMYVEQNGRCSCCNTPITKSAHTDHNHSNGTVRALLCNGCNTGLGSFGDSPSRLQKAYSYLMRVGYYGEH